MNTFEKNFQYVKFCSYGFLKNLRLFDPFLLLFFLDYGISFTQIGVLYAARELTTNISEIPSGIVADTFGRKNSLIVAFLIFIASFTVFYISSNFNLLLIAMILFGIADAFRSGTHKGMIMDYLALNNWSHLKVEYYGHTRSWSQLGSALSALLAGVLVFYEGNYRNIFIISIIPYLLNLINVMSYPKAINFSKKIKYNTAIVGLGESIGSFISMIKKPKVLQIINSTALHTAYLKAIKDYIQPLMIQVALIIPFVWESDSKKTSGLIVGIIYFFIFLLTSSASKNSSRIRDLGIKNMANKTLILGFSAGLICGLAFYFDMSILALLFFIVIYILENVRKPFMTGEISDQVPNEILTSVISAQSFFSTIMTAALALFLGLLADQWGIGLAFVIISSALMTFTFLLSWINNKETNLPTIDR